MIPAIHAVVCFGSSYSLLFWLLAFAGAVVSTRLDFLKDATAYGRIRRPASSVDATTKPSPRPWLTKMKTAMLLLLSLDVPKSWFTHFYVVGTTVNSLVLLDCWYQQSENFHVEKSSYLAAGPGQNVGPCCWVPWLPSALLHLHLLRRLYECLFVHVFSPSGRMGITVYAGGLAHYLVAPLSFGVVCSGVTPAPWGPSASLSGSELAADIRVSGGDSQSPSMLAFLGAVFATGIFLASTFMQHVAHVYLASLRTSGNACPNAATLRTPHPAGGRGSEGSADFTPDPRHGPSQHVMPSHTLFSRISCPHYTAEVGIYFGLFALAWSVAGTLPVSLLALTAWVAANLTVTARRIHKHNLATFRSYPKHRTPMWPDLFLLCVAPPKLKSDNHLA